MIYDRRTELRVKIKSLAEEARIIRLEEKRAKAAKEYGLLFRLQEHRRHDLRSELRSANLAYGLMRFVGVPALEACCHTLPDMERIEELLRSFGPIQVDGESKEQYVVRRETVLTLRAGQMLALESNSKQSVANWHSGQASRQIRNAERRRKYHEKKAAKQAATAGG